MRWIFNTILIVFCLGLVFILVNTGDVKHDFITGFVFFDTNNIPVDCDQGTLQTLWGNVFDKLLTSGDYIAEPNSDLCGLYMRVSSSGRARGVIPNDQIWILKVEDGGEDIKAGHYIIPSTVGDFSEGAEDIDDIDDVFGILDANAIVRNPVVSTTIEASNIANGIFLFSTNSNDYLCNDPSACIYSSNEFVDQLVVSESIIVDKNKGKITYLLSSFASNIVFSGSIPNMSTEEDSVLVRAIDLDDYFSGTGISFDFNVDNRLSFAIDDQNRVNITPRLDFFGIVRLDISASDTVRSVVSNEFTIDVTPVNDPPKFNNMPNITWRENRRKKIRLDDYFSEVDGEALNYTFNDTNLDHIDISIDSDDSDVTFDPDANWTGTESVTFTARDESGLATESNEVFLTVREGTNLTNNAPIILSRNPIISLVNLKVGESKTFSITVRDIDNDTIDYIWTLNNVDQNNNNNQYLFSGSSEGNFVLKVVASDGFIDVDRSWNIVVTSISDINDSASPSPEQPRQRSLLGSAI